MSFLKSTFIQIGEIFIYLAARFSNNNYKVNEVVVSHHKRLNGKSNYKF